MREVQIFQAAAAAIGAIIITFLQPQRDEIGTAVIGTYGLIAVTSIWAASHIVTAMIQKKLRSYISNGIILLAFVVYLLWCFIELKRFVIAAEDIKRGDILTMDNFTFGILAGSWLIFGGVALLVLALTHRKFPKIYKDNLITAGIFLVSAVGVVVSNDIVSRVGFLNASLIFTAVHLGIASASPNGIAAASPKTKA
jgi:hypothetical protein